MTAPDASGRVTPLRPSVPTGDPASEGAGDRARNAESRRRTGKPGRSGVPRTSDPLPSVAWPVPAARRDIAAGLRRADGWDERTARMAWSALAEPADPVAARLLATHGQAGAALAALADEARATRETFARRWDALDLQGDLAATSACGARILIPGDDEWPAGLDVLAEPPYCLWVRGPLSLGPACERSVAIVGARASSAYGEHLATELGAGLAERGFTVVSGAAFGIDGAAHRGALAVDGRTVAVLAGGVDRPYPQAHSALLDEIARSGAVVSEVPPGAAPLRQRFLLRNRLIATATRGTVVVEAGLRSGSRNTAGTADAHARIVMAVPGPVTSMTSAGCHEMIRSGMAVLVTDAAEVAEAVGDYGTDLAPPRRGPTTAEDRLDEPERRVRDALPSRTGSSVEILARDAGLAESAVRAALGRLELAGLAERDAWGWRLAGATRRGGAAP